ncbi:MAG TPA: MAPEG family protein [Steroidobacteraceae bacterium]|nr:MAPEG family protein [Steroidobacteraceae bacterium]
MIVTHLVYPMAAMVLLTVVVLVSLFRSRVAAVRTGQIDKTYFRLYQGSEEPELARKVSRHFSNLFEAPVLFYVACLAAMISGVTGLLFVSLAWAYVIARVWHAFIHLGGNRLSKRIVAYFVSWIVLVAMWVTLVVAVSWR